MNTYKVIFTIKNAIHPFTETVKAENVEAAKASVQRLVKEAGCTLKQIVSIVQV